MLGGSHAARYRRARLAEETRCHRMLAKEGRLEPTICRWRLLSVNLGCPARTSPEVHASIRPLPSRPSDQTSPRLREEPTPTIAAAGMKSMPVPPVKVSAPTEALRGPSQRVGTVP